MYKIVLYRKYGDKLGFVRDLCSTETLSDANCFYRFYEKEYSDESFVLMCIIDFNA